jgi:phosphatidyl-myo-inositol dimannoside synthase
VTKPLIAPCCLAVPSLGGAGDGVAYVARLLHAAIRDLSGCVPAAIELGGNGTAVPLSRRAWFVGRVLLAQAAGRWEWLIYNHVGLARAQRMVPRRIRRPYAIVLNGIEVWPPDLDESRKAVLRGASLRLAVSRHTARRVSAVHPDIGEVVACPLGLLPDREAEGEVDSTLLHRIPPLSVLIVGRMSSAERYKGHDMLLDAWRSVLDAVPDACLVVVGRGDDSDRLMTRAAQLGLGQHVLFTGFVTEATLRALYRRAAVFAMPSRGEGFGLVYLEAMRAGLPCIGSTADAAGDIIRHGETGFLVDPDDTGDLVDSLRLLLDNAELRDRFGAAGLHRFRHEYSYEPYRDRLGAALRHVFPSTPETTPCAE